MPETSTAVAEESRVLRAYRHALKMHHNDAVPEFRAVFVQRFADLLGEETGEDAVRISNYGLMLQTAKDEYLQVSARA